MGQPSRRALRISMREVYAGESGVACRRSRTKSGEDEVQYAKEQQDEQAGHRYSRIQREGEVELELCLCRFDDEGLL